MENTDAMKLPDKNTNPVIPSFIKIHIHPKTATDSNKMTRKDIITALFHHAVTFRKENQAQQPARGYTMINRKKYNPDI